MSSSAKAMPVISKIYCSSSQTKLLVRRRPNAVNGGGFVVTDCTQNVIFRVDGCGVLGLKGELIVRDADGDAVVLIRRKGGVVEALSIQKKWKGFAFDYEGSKKLAFILKEPPVASCLPSNAAIKISTETAAASGSSSRSCNFEVRGYFPDRDCCIVDSLGNAVAQIGATRSKDVYYIGVKPGTDQAFVVGVVATLDYIHGESTKC